jgi:hypothetical protein
MRYLITLAICMACFHLAAQTQKSYLSLYTSLANGTSVSSDMFFSKTKGGASIEGNSMSLIGMDYTRPINKWLSWSAGLEYADHSLTKRNHDFYPGMPAEHGRIQRITAPLYLRADIWNFVFMTFGTVLNVDVKNNITGDQSGLGITGGTGVKMDIKRFRFYLQPYYQWFALSFNPDTEAHLFQLGLRTGIAVRL